MIIMHIFFNQGNQTLSLIIFTLIYENTPEIEQQRQLICVICLCTGTLYRTNYLS